MLLQYEDDYRTGMDVCAIAKLIWDYTGGYPFPISRICQLVDEKIIGSTNFESKTSA